MPGDDYLPGDNYLAVLQASYCDTPSKEVKKEKETTLCNDCAKYLTPNGIDWHVLCPRCKKIFVKE